MNYFLTDRLGSVDAVTDGNGNLMPGGNRYTIRVTVANSNVLLGVPAADALLVNVTVTDPVGARMIVSGVRLRP